MTAYYLLLSILTMACSLGNLVPAFLQLRALPSFELLQAAEFVLLLLAIVLMLSVFAWTMAMACRAAPRRAGPTQAMAADVLNDELVREASDTAELPPFASGCEHFFIGSDSMSEVDSDQHDALVWRQTRKWQQAVHDRRRTLRRFRRRCGAGHCAACLRRRANPSGSAGGSLRQ